MDPTTMTNKSSQASSEKPTLIMSEPGLSSGFTEGYLVSQKERQTPIKRIPYRRNTDRDLGVDKAKRTILISGPTDNFLLGLVETWDISYGEAVDRIVNDWRTQSNA